MVKNFLSKILARDLNGLNIISTYCEDSTTSVSEIKYLKKKYTKDCVALICVHMGGHPSQMEKIKPWAKKKKLLLSKKLNHFWISFWIHVFCLFLILMYFSIKFEILEKNSALAILDINKIKIKTNFLISSIFNLPI